MKLLDHIWHVPFHILNSLDKEAVEDVVRWIGDRETPEEMRKTLTAAFCRSADDYHRFSDLFNYYLAEYVCQIYGMAKARKMPLLCFTNINYADDDLLQFLLLLIKKFDGDICILLELRTSLYIDGHVSERTWTNFLSSIYQMPNLRLRIELEEWEADETAEYIRQKARPMKLSLNCVRSIQQRVGCNPLHLDTFLSYICMAAEADIPSSYLEEYIINCPIENIDDVIFRLIERVTRSLPCAGAIFFFLGMLSGQASEEVLEDCVGRSIHETLDRLATETPLLWRGGSEIHISHSLYLAAVQRTNYISAFQKQELASRLLERLDGLSMDALHSGSVRVELLQILKEFDLAATHAFELAEDLFRDGQYQASYRYYTVARTCLNKLYACPLYARADTLPAAIGEFHGGRTRAELEGLSRHVGALSGLRSGGRSSPRGVSYGQKPVFSLFWEIPGITGDGTRDPIAPVSSKMPRNRVARLCLGGVRDCGQRNVLPTTGALRLLESVGCLPGVQQPALCPIHPHVGKLFSVRP